MWGVGFRVCGLGFGVWGSEFGVCGLGFRGLGFGVWGLAVGCRVSSPRFWVEGVGFWV